MEEALIKRIPPHSIEAEQSVIGAMLLDRDAILIASEILTSDDFYQNQYGIIFDAMVELCNEGKPVDLITLQNRLKEKDLPPDISSMEYVRELIEAVPTSANVKYYANIVSEKALLRRLIKATEDVANTCYLEKESTEMILEESEKKLFNILQRSIGGDYVPIQQVVLNAINNIEKASKLKGSVTGIPTGFIDLDYKTSGMHPSDLVLIAARPSMGKTAFVLNIAQYMAFRKDVTVAIFSLEMSKEQLVNRLLAMESHVDSQYMRMRMLMAGYQGYNIQEPLLHMRAGSEMYKRRAGWKYAETQMRLLRFMRGSGFIGNGQYIKSCVIRSGSALAPN